MKAKYTTKNFRISTAIYNWIKSRYGNVNKGIEKTIQQIDADFTIYSDAKGDNSKNQLFLFTKDLDVAALDISEQIKSDE